MRVFLVVGFFFLYSRLEIAYNRNNKIEVWSVICRRDTDVLSYNTLQEHGSVLGLVGLGFLHSLTTMIYSKQGLVCMWVVVMIVKIVSNLNFRKTACICICPLLLLKLVLDVPVKVGETC